MAPGWLTVLAWVALALGGLSAIAIAIDIFGRGHRQKMWIMEAVWPITGLYLGPLAWFAYRRWGLASSSSGKVLTGVESDYGEPVSVAIGVCHCGAGCTLGDIVGEWIIFATGASLAGATLWPEYIADFALAFLLGIAFQYFSIAPMRNLGVRDGLLAALKADSLSLASFEIGLFGWMALSYFVFFPGPHLSAGHPAYWLLMQIGMAIGFLTAYPTNVWLIRRGIKEGM